MKKLVSTMILLTMISTLLFSGCKSTEKTKNAGKSGSGTEVTDNSGKGSEKDTKKGTGNTFEDRMKAAEKSTITVGGGFDEGYYAPFLRQYPDLKLKIETMPYGNLALLASAIAAGNQPDMYFTRDMTSSPLVYASKEKLIQPLDDYLNNDPEYNLKNLPDWYPDYTTYDGKIYAVYTDVSSEALVWNKDLFKKAGLDPDTPPQTRSEFLDYAKKLTAFDSNGMVKELGYRCGGGFEAWILSTGKQYQEKDGKVNINTPEVANTFEFLKKTIGIYGGDDKIPDTINWDKGNIAMVNTDIGYSNNMKNKNFAVGIAPLPRPDELKDHEPYVTGYINQWYGIPTGAKNPDGAWLLLKYCVTGGVSNVMEGEAIDHPETWVPVFMTDPAAKNALFDKYLDNTRPDIKQSVLDREEIYKKINIKRSTNSIINAKWNGVMVDGMFKMLNGEVTVTDELAALQKQADQIYEDYQSGKINLKDEAKKEEERIAKEKAEAEKKEKDKEGEKPEEEEKK